MSSTVDVLRFNHWFCDAAAELQSSISELRWLSSELLCRWPSAGGERWITGLATSGREGGREGGRLEAGLGMQ